MSDMLVDIARGILLGLFVCYGVYCLVAAESGIVFRYAGY